EDRHFHPGRHRGHGQRLRRQALREGPGLQLQRARGRREATMKRSLAAVIGTLILCVTGVVNAATTKTPDYSELWWNSSENGWGASITQQDDIVFLVLYVYDAQRNPRFFVAPAMQLQSATGSDNVFTGSLYRTVGSPSTSFTFDPNRYAAT